jgi:hypothetical protein
MDYQHEGLSRRREGLKNRSRIESCSARFFLVANRRDDWQGIRELTVSELDWTSQSFQSFS